MSFDALATAQNIAVVTPDDSTDLTHDARALYVGTAGNVKVTTTKGITAVIPNVQAGLLPVQVRRVWSTGTTASNLTALW